MTKIGVDAFPLQKLHGGVSYYIFFLLDELIQVRPNDTFVLFTNKNSEDIQYFKKYQNVQIAVYPLSIIGHSLWAQTFLSYGCWVNDIDIFWGTTQSIPLIKKSKMKTMLTLHDFTYLLAPETMSLYKQLYLNFFSRRMLTKANAILPNSEGTGLKLNHFYGIGYTAVICPPLKTELIFQENPNDFLHSHELVYKAYLITIGTLEPRKNLQKLIEIYLETLKEKGPEIVIPLVIVGGGGWKNKELVQILSLAKKKYPKHFFLMGYRTDKEIAYLLTGARYCLMVSKYEGYGMPLAEARMCQTAVICLDQPEMREASENDGVFLSPNTWTTEIRSYFLCSSEITKPQYPRYMSNREKSLKLSEVINFLPYTNNMKNREFGKEAP